MTAEQIANLGPAFSSYLQVFRGCFETVNTLGTWAPTAACDLGCRFSNYYVGNLIPRVHAGWRGGGWFSMRPSPPADRPLIDAKRDAQHRRLRAEVEAEVRRISILGAEELEDAILIGPLFDPDELAVLPFAVDEGGGGLAGAQEDMLGLLLLGGAGGPEVNAAVVAGDEELVVAKLGDEGAAFGQGVALGGAPWDAPYDTTAFQVPKGRVCESLPCSAPLKRSGSATAWSLPSKLRRATSRCIGPISL